MYAILSLLLKFTVDFNVCNRKRVMPFGKLIVQFQGVCVASEAQSEQPVCVRVFRGLGSSAPPLIIMLLDKDGTKKVSKVGLGQKIHLKCK